MGEPNRLDSLAPPGEVKNQDHFRYPEETKLAWEEGKLSEDIVEEQRKLTQADLVIFQVCVVTILGVLWQFISALMSDVLASSSG